MEGIEINTIETYIKYPNPPPHVQIFAVIVGEFANFIAYIYAPAVLVTPLGALSIIVR